MRYYCFSGTRGDEINKKQPKSYELNGLLLRNIKGVIVSGGNRHQILILLILRNIGLSIFRGGTIICETLWINKSGGYEQESE